MADSDTSICPNKRPAADRRLFTSAAVTSSVDLALALVEEDLGPEAALNVARELVVYLKRSGGQMQYSMPLQLQTQATGDLAVIVRLDPRALA